MRIVSPSNKFKEDIVHSIIGVTGRNVTLVVVKTIEPVYDYSDDDPFVSNNKGMPTSESYFGKDIIAGVRWRTDNKKIYAPEGQYVEGDCEIVLKYSEEVEKLLQRVRYVIVDNKTCSINKYFSKGNPLNRIYIHVLEEDVILGHRIG